MDQHGGQAILELDDAVLTVVDLRFLERSCEEQVRWYVATWRDMGPVRGCHCERASGSSRGRRAWGAKEGGEASWQAVYMKHTYNSTD